MTTVHAGSIARWFEALCRIDVPKLSDIARDNQSALRPNALPANGGVYCYWWTGDAQILFNPECQRKLTMAGPSGRLVDVEFDEDWLGTVAKCPVPLYVGKTADSIAKRTGAHLLLKSERAIQRFAGTRKQKRPTTSCQLRAGIDQMFPQRPDTRSLLLENVGLSFVLLHGNDHAANRFYLETMAIGLMRPPLNIDVER